jgi:hypothetical protein
MWPSFNFKIVPCRQCWGGSIAAIYSSRSDGLACSACHGLQWLYRREVCHAGRSFRILQIDPVVLHFTAASEIRVAPSCAKSQPDVNWELVCVASICCIPVEVASVQGAVAYINEIVTI